jgi:hypothetical protein
MPDPLNLAYLIQIIYENKMERFKLKYYKVLLPALLLFVISCSSTEETQYEKQEDSTYVFDKVPPEDLYIFESPVVEEDTSKGIIYSYIVQIGAFTAMERANQFADFSRRKLNMDIKVNFNERANLYVVQIHPPFETRNEAEKYRNELWNYDEFNDAWIITVEKEK